MKITDLKTTIVAVPYKEEETISYGVRLGLTNTLVEIETNEGIRGIGECMAFPNAEVMELVLQQFKPLLLGQDPFNVEAITQLFYYGARWAYFKNLGNSALAGIEMALWDIIGKACGQPIHRLMGGALHDHIPIFAWIQRKSIEAMAEEAAQAVREGYQVVYIKVGLGRDLDVQACSAIRKAIGPKPKLRVDANEAWTEGEAIRTINLLAEYDLDFVEQPVSMYDLASLARVRSAVRVPISVDQGVWLDQHLVQALRLGAGDVLTTNPHKLGGMFMMKKVAAAAGMAGMTVCKHSFPELGITLAAGLQILATLPNMDIGNQNYLRLLADDVIEGGLIKPENGTVPVPTGPGLGVSLDYDKVNQYAELYREQGPFTTRSFK